MTHTCIGNLTIIGPDNGLSPGRRQAIIWTNDGILLVNKLQWNLNQNSNIFIHKSMFESVVCEMASISSRPQCVKRSCTDRIMQMVWALSCVVVVQYWSVITTFFDFTNILKSYFTGAGAIIWWRVNFWKAISIFTSMKSNCVLD